MTTTTAQITDLPFTAASDAIDAAAAAQTRSPSAFADARAALAEIAARHALPADARELGAALRERDGDRAATDREEAASLVWGWLADDRVIIVVGEVVDGYLGA
jgi:hypothetical protein